MRAANPGGSLTGQRISHYQILSLLGAGGMGDVYLAQDTRLDRKVALKILPALVASDPDRMQRFIREAKAASAFNHPNVAAIYDVGEANGTRFIAMEYVEGQTLAARIAEGPLDPASTIEIGIQVADALSEAHARGITHRDIKPANLMLDSRGQVKVLDFGIAKISRADEHDPKGETCITTDTAAGTVMGSVPYMSPEQVLGRDIDSRSDIFSLGVSLYEMATGKLPFSGMSLGETMDQILHTEPEPISSVNLKTPAEFERIVRKALDKDRNRRYPTARELLTDLQNLQTGSRPGIVDLERHAPPRRSKRRTVVAALAAAAIALTVYAITRIGSGDQPIDSIAVLPFSNAIDDPDAEYLSDGITESLINSLSQVPKLRVIARTTAFTYKGKESIDPSQIYKKLNARAVLTGRFVQRGDTLAIQVDLIDAAAGSQLWGKGYTLKRGEVLTLENEIAALIPGKLRLGLSGEERQRLTKRYTENIEAYQLYLKGRYHAYKYTDDGMKKGIEHLTQAIQIDRGYALAYAGLSEAYMIGSGWYLPSLESGEKAKGFASKALMLDDKLAEAHIARGYVAAAYDWDWPGAEGEFKRAIELNAGSGPAHDYYGQMLGMTGRLNESLAELQRAQQLDPLSVEISTQVGTALYFARRYDEAIEQLRKATDLDPNFWLARTILMSAYAQKGMYADAVVECQKMGDVGFVDAPAMLAYVWGVSGRKADALKAIDKMKQSKPPVTTWGMAMAYTGLGDKDQAFAWFQKARDERFIIFASINVDPVFDSLRSDPRFHDLLVSIHLAR